MLEKEIQHIKVGFFVLSALVVAMLIIFMIGAEKKIFQSHYTLRCTFSDISGLRVGAPVQLAGLNIGFVNKIQFPKDLMQKKIVISLDISEKFQERIREDSVATINTQGLLGDKFIYISIGSPDKPVLADGAKIQTKEVVGIFELAEKGGEILEDLQVASKGVSKFFSDLHGGRDDFQQTLSAVSNILNEVKKGRGLVHALIYDPKGEEILADLSATMHSAKIIMGQSEDGEKRRGKMQNIAQNINKAALNISEITEKINSGQGTIGGLIEDPTIYNEIRSLFGKANRNSLFRTVVRATLEENEKQVLK